MAEPDPCEVCEHPFDPHVLLALEPSEGGIIRCPEEDCECESTWSPSGVDKPPSELVEHLREMWNEHRGSLLR